MEFLNVGPLELLIIVILMFVLLGPKEMILTAQRIGRWVRSVVRSPMWREVMGYSQEIRELPQKIMDESGLKETIEEVRKDTKAATDELNAQMKEVQEAARVKEAEHLRIEYNAAESEPKTIAPPAEKPAVEAAASPELAPHQEPAPKTAPPAEAAPAAKTPAPASAASASAAPATGSGLAGAIAAAAAAAAAKAEAKSKKLDDSGRLVEETVLEAPAAVEVAVAQGAAAPGAVAQGAEAQEAAARQEAAAQEAAAREAAAREAAARELSAAQPAEGEVPGAVVTVAEKVRKPRARKPKAEERPEPVSSGAQVYPQNANGSSAAVEEIASQPGEDAPVKRARKPRTPKAGSAPVSAAPDNGATHDPAREETPNTEEQSHRDAA